MKNNISKSILTLTCISLLTTSCYKNFYYTNTQKAFTKIEAEKVNDDPNKYVIVHFSDQTLELTKYSITIDSIVGEINKIEIQEHLLYLNPTDYSSNSYKKRYESAVLNEVHIYTPLKSNLKNTNHTQLASRDISRIDIYQKDKNRTTTNHILSSLGVAACFTGLIAFLAFATIYGGFLTGGFVFI
jgi:hypothetical protein